MSQTDEYSILYENISNGTFMLKELDIPIGKVTKLKCKLYSVMGKPFYKGEHISGTIDKTIINYVPNIKIENYDLPRKKISSDDLPLFLDNLSVVLSASKKYNVIRKENERVILKLELEAIPEVPYLILYDDLNDRYSLNNLDFNVRLIEEKKLD